MKKITAAFLAGLLAAGCAGTPASATASAEPKEELTQTEEPSEKPEIESAIESPAPVLGGWSVNTDYNAYLNEGDITRFNDAVKGLTGVGYDPIQVIATQLVSGTNYKALCYGTTVTEKPVGDLYIVDWYEDLQGNASISKVESLNLAYYVAGE